MRSFLIVYLLLLFSSSPFGNVNRDGPVLTHDNATQFVALAPDVIVLDPEAPTITVTSEVLEFKVLILSRLLPLTSVTLTLNGKVFDRTKLENEVEEKRKRFQNTYKIPLHEGENAIEITASNIKASSKPVIRIVTYKPSLVSTKPNLVVLSIGVSGYKNIPNHLFAIRDAEAFAKVLNLKGTSRDLYGDVKTQIITDDAASRLGVVKGLGWLNSQVVSDADVRVLFLSGAFLMDYTTENAYFLSSDYEPKTDPEISSLNLRVIFARLANLPNPILVFIDTTGASAGATRAAFRQIDDYSSQGNLFVYLCCDSKSAVTPQSDHSSFASAILEGLNGKADINKDGLIDTSELRKWLMSQVPSLSDGALYPAYLGNQKALPIFKPTAQP